MPENMLSNFKFIYSAGAGAAGVTTLDGAVIDMAQDEGYDGVCVIAILGDIVATAVNNLQLMGSAAANGSSPSVEFETGVGTAGATDWDNKLMVLDVRCPANRYVFARLVRTVANTILQGILMVLYKPRKFPVTQGSDVIKAAYDWVLGT